MLFIVQYTITDARRFTGHPEAILPYPDWPTPVQPILLGRLIAFRSAQQHDLIGDHFGHIALFALFRVGIAAGLQLARYAYFITFPNVLFDDVRNPAPSDNGMPIGGGAFFALVVFVAFIGRQE